MRLARLLLIATLLGCGAAGGTPVLRLEDPAGDVRLRHPEGPGVERGTFDLRSVSIERLADRIVVEAELGAVVAPLAPIPSDADARRARFLPTVEVYLDFVAGAGNAEAIAGRDFHVPVSQAWDRVLILADLPRAPHPDAIAATHLTARGRVLRGDFPAGAIPEAGVAGALAVVTATALTPDDGWIRRVSAFKGDCTTWNDRRCTLIGAGPPVLDATAEVRGATLELTYPAGAPKEVPGVPVVFHREAVVTVAPVGPGVRTGSLATVVDAVGQPLGTAVVESVVGDTATLRLVGSRAAGEPAHAVFGEAP